MNNGDNKTTKYRLVKKDKLLHTGITDDPEKREDQHQKQFPGSTLKPVDKPTSRDKALEWERTQPKTRTPKKKD
jgi:predicted GIY-YIG superfamily endonuclease